MIDKIPEPIGKFFAYVPYAVRLGFDYGTSLKNSGFVDSVMAYETKDFIFIKPRTITVWGHTHTRCYQKFYAASNFCLNDLCSFDDIQIFGWSKHIEYRSP